MNIQDDIKSINDVLSRCHEHWPIDPFCIVNIVEFAEAAKEALEFYADRKNQEPGKSINIGNGYGWFQEPSLYACDLGGSARRCLEKYFKSL